ncbi:MAG: hypothetical protein KJ950_02215 [Proteobacteria bacterium]|nr:hypothetical protein [Pseudomonadota bacterium]
MKRIIQLVILVVIQLWMMSGNSLALTVEDYLILSNISGYKFVTQMKDFYTDEMKTITGYTQGNHSGIIAGTSHFSEDHSDITYKTDYYNQPLQVAISVQVTQHTGGDSDQWLLHEVERGFRRGDVEEYMTPSRFRAIDNHNFFYSGLGGGTYRWISDNLVVNIEYVDLYKQKPEPLEVVIAYLNKFPSTISAIAIDQAHDEQWIKDEMERRLWLGDKWFAWQEAGNSDVAETLREVNRNIEVFLNYREKYFGINADLEKESLYTLISNQNLQGMKDKLAEYKSWWATNKSGSINLP